MNLNITIVKKGDEISISSGDWKLEWSHIGEGRCGDFDAKNPQDERLLRADLFYKNAPCVDGSYCTHAPLGTSWSELLTASMELFEKLELPTEMTQDGWRYNRREMERWTWRDYPTIARNDVTDCDECGNPIPDSHPSMVNEHHKDNCSLYRRMP